LFISAKRIDEVWYHELCRHRPTAPFARRSKLIGQLDFGLERVDAARGFIERQPVCRNCAAG
jgi:hypothetical protein